MLDKNSIVIHEKKQFFYYYGPFYDQYQFWLRRSWKSWNGLFRFRLPF
jgi:hypothetical protein